MVPEYPEIVPTLTLRILNFSNWKILGIPWLNPSGLLNKLSQSGEESYQSQCNTVVSIWLVAHSSHR